MDHRVFRELFAALSEGRTRDCILKLEEMVVQGRELGQFITDFIWYFRNLLLLKTAEDAEDLLDMSEENINLLREDAALASEYTLTRYIRIFSDLSNQLRYASQKRVLIEIAFIKLTKPEMEQSLDSVLERLDRMERQLGEGVPQRLISGAQSGEPAVRDAGQSANAGSEITPEPQTVTLPKAQLADLNLIRNEWGKIVRELGMSARPSFRETVVEPAGEGCLCIVFQDSMNYSIGSRPSVLGDLERYVEQVYQKEIYFKARLRESGERLNTRYISDEELKENIHMDIMIED